MLHRCTLCPGLFAEIFSECLVGRLHVVHVRLVDENVMLLHLLCLVRHLANQVSSLLRKLAFLHYVRLLHVAGDLYFIHQLHLIAASRKPLETTRFFPLVLSLQLWQSLLIRLTFSHF